MITVKLGFAKAVWRFGGNRKGRGGGEWKTLAKLPTVSEVVTASARSAKAQDREGGGIMLFALRA